MSLSMVSFKEDGGENAFAGEAWACDDARPHLMHESKHLVVVTRSGP